LFETKILFVINDKSIDSKKLNQILKEAYENHKYCKACIRKFDMVTKGCNEIDCFKAIYQKYKEGKFE